MKKHTGFTIAALLAALLMHQAGQLETGLALDLGSSITYYSVYFHDTDLPNVRVAEGALVEAPDTPVKNGFDFHGWYADFNYSTPYDFLEPVYENLILYPRWDPSAGAVAGDYYFISSATGFDLAEARPLIRDYEADMLTYRLEVTSIANEEFQIINHLSAHATTWGIDINNSKHVFRRAGNYELVFTPEDFNGYDRNIELVDLESEEIDPNDLLTVYDEPSIDYYFLSPYQSISVKAYFWTDSIRLIERWPGVDMEYIQDIDEMQLFKITVEKGIYDYVKFSSSSGSPTTPSIDLANYSDDAAGQKWCFYTKSGNYFAFDYSTGLIPDNIGKMATYYYEVAVSSPTIYAYAYRGTHENEEWPGLPANYIETLTNGRRIYGITMMEEDFYYVIFHDSSAGLLKTPSLDLRGLPSGVCFRTSNNTETSPYSYYLYDEKTEIDYYYQSSVALSGDFYAYFYDGLVLGPTPMAFVEMTETNQYLYVTTIDQVYNYVVFRGYDDAETYLESPEIALADHPENTVFYLTGSGYDSYLYEPTIETLTYYFETKNPARIQYAYLRDGAVNNGWPGVVMDTLGTDTEGVRTYRITFESNLWTEIRFINNNSSILTEYVPLAIYPSETVFYEIDNVVDGYPYETERPYEIPDVEYPNTITYFFETQVVADAYYAYFWRSGTNNTWPGYTMVYEGTFGGYMLYSTELTPDYWYNAIFSCTDKVVKTPTIELRDGEGNWIYPDGTVFYYKNATVGSYLFGEARPYSLHRREAILPPSLIVREEGVD